MMDFSKEWDKRYNCVHFIYGTEPNEFLMQSVSQLKPESKILCLADGEGRNSTYLAKLGHHVTAIDFSSIAKEKALGLAKENHVKINYIVCDMNEYPFKDNQWDAVVSIFAHTDSAIRHKIWNSVKYSLKKNGLFILEAYHPNQILFNYNSGGPKNIDWLVSLDDIMTSFQNFKPCHQSEVEREVNEGTLHHGKAFVTQYIGQKIE
jgi:SAM-dependent methyltransferase